MLSEARAHPQPHMPRQMHFSLLQKLNSRSCGLIFLIQNQRSNRKYMALVYLWRTLAIKLSKSISKFCTSTFNPSERCCALPFQRLPCSGAGLAVSGARSLAQPQPALHSPRRAMSTRRGDTVNSDTVHPLRMSADLNYLLISYYITEKDSEEKKPLPTRLKRK